MKGLVLAGGTGSRLRPITHTGPKQLIPIANKPNILYCLEDLRAAGITDIGVILGNNQPHLVRRLLGDGSPWGVRVTYIEQGEPRGIAHAIGVAEPFLGADSFAVYLGDNVLKGGIRNLVLDFEASRADAAIALCRVPNPQAFGVAVLGDDGRLLKTLEKPKVPPSDLAIIGVYIFTPSVFPIIRSLKPSARNELEVTDAINQLLASGRQIQTHIVTGWWKDTGRPEDILEVNRLVLDDLDLRQDVASDSSVQIEGRVGIGSGTRVGAKSVLIGPSIIGRNCMIGPGCRIGPYASIGDNCVLEAAHVEDSVIFEGVTIRTDRRIVGSLVGKDVSILNGVRQPQEGFQLFVGENSVLRL